MRKIYFVLAGALALAGIGCGQTNGAITPMVNPLSPYGIGSAYAAPTCAVGQVSMNYQCYPDLPTACSYNSGTLITLNGSVQVCKYSPYRMSSMSIQTSGLPILDAQDPTGPYSLIDYYYSVMSGDTITMTASGGWSYNAYNTSSWLGGLLQFSTLNYQCDDVTVNGYPTSGSTTTQVTYENQPSGLAASNGTEWHFFGSSATVVFGSAGQFRIGFNAPPNYGGCTNTTIGQITVTRCQDASNNTYACQ